MSLTRREQLAFFGAAAALVVLPKPAFAGTIHEVQMLNVHPDDPTEFMVFYPDIVRAMPGDIVRFVTVDTFHNAVAYKNMIPDGVEPWGSKLSQDFDLTVTVDGAHCYFCAPHKSYGMVGLLLVGDVSGNYQAVKDARKRGKSKARFADIFERADKMLAAEV